VSPRKGFRRLVHPNGICLTGLWQITADTGYSGYFRNGSRALVVGRYSTCCRETRRGHVRSLSLVGKLFPTADPDHVEPLATRHAVPATFPNRDYPAIGGLMSYGTSIWDAFRQTGVYAGRILKGAIPADLSVVQSSKFELVINTSTARMLGLTVPDKLLVAAAEVIE
jgi:ABC transporter substrate binding protein